MVTNREKAQKLVDGIKDRLGKMKIDLNADAGVYEVNFSCIEDVLDGLVSLASEHGNERIEEYMESAYDKLFELVGDSVAQDFDVMSKFKFFDRVDDPFGEKEVCKVTINELLDFIVSQAGLES